MGYSPWSNKRVKHNLATKQQQHSENGYITFKGERAALSTQNMEGRRQGVSTLKQKKNSTILSQAVQSLSHVRLFATPRIAARQASLSITNSWSLLKLMPIESVMPSSHLILCRPLLLLPPITPS